MSSTGCGRGLAVAPFVLLIAALTFSGCGGGGTTGGGGDDCIAVAPAIHLPLSLNSTENTALEICGNMGTDGTFTGFSEIARSRKRGTSRLSPCFPGSIVREGW